LSAGVSRAGLAVVDPNRERWGERDEAPPRLTLSQGHQETD